MTCVSWVAHAQNLPASVITTRDTLFEDFEESGGEIFTGYTDPPFDSTIEHYVHPGYYSDEQNYMLQGLRSQLNLRSMGSPCDTLGFEDSDLSSWTGYYHNGSGANPPCCPIPSTTTGLIPGVNAMNEPLGVCTNGQSTSATNAARHTITSGTATDPNTDGVVPIVAPDGGNFSIRLGNHEPGWRAECMEKTFTVTNDNALFTYMYAVVLQDPANSHPDDKRPQFEISITDQSGDPLPCAGFFKVTSNQAAGSGFVRANAPVCETSPSQQPDGGSDIWYKNWTPVATDLSNYIGQQVTIKFCTADCGQGGHYGYAYIDGYCSNLPELVSPAPVCPYESVTIDAPEGFGGYLWSTGETTQSITINDPIDGQVISLELSTVQGCKTTLTDTIHVNPQPTADFNSNVVCLNEVTSLTDASVPASGDSKISFWQWTFDDPASGVQNSSTLQNPDHQYTAAGDFDVELIITSENGCRDTIVKPVSVYPLPNAGFNAPPVCLDNNTIFTDQSVSSGVAITKWNWSFGDSGPAASTNQNPVFQYGSAGVFQASLKVTDVNGCADSTILPVEVYGLPVADFNATDVCLNEANTFTDNSSSNGTPVDQWKWSFGDDQSGTSASRDTVYQYEGPGNYQVELVVTTQDGCEDSVTKPVVVYSLPVADFDVPNACFGESVKFTDESVSADGAITQWSWDFDQNSATSTVQQPDYQYTVSGTYEPELIVTTANGCKDTIRKNVSIYELPVADFSNSLNCLGEATQFMDQSTANEGALVKWIWDLGDGDNSNLKDPTHTFMGTGPYQVKLLVETDLGCRDSIKKLVVTKPLPEADFDNTLVCFGSATEFEDKSVPAAGDNNIINWLWDFGDPASDSLNNSMAQNPAHTYTGDKGFTVTLIVTSENQCVDTVSKPIYVVPVPVADFEFKNVCFGDSMHFMDKSTSPAGPVSGWKWNFGDPLPGTSIFPDPVYLYTSPGKYKVTLEISSEGCTDTVTKTVEVYPQPVAKFSKTIACLGDSTEFTDLSSIDTSGSITSYSWSLGDNTTSQDTSPVHFYNGIGPYVVALEVRTDDGCSDKASGEVYLHPSPDADFIGADVCLNKITGFTNKSFVSPGKIVNWQWDFGDSSGVSNENSPEYKYSKDGVYNVKLSVTTDSGCVATITKPIEVFPLPQVHFGPPDSGCLPLNAILFDSTEINRGKIISWVWNFGDPYSGAKNISTLQHPVHTYEREGEYDVSLSVVSDKGCKASKKMVSLVKVFGWPDADFTYDPKETTIFDPWINFTDLSSDDAVKWFWDFDDGDKSILQNPTHEFKEPREYRIRLAIENIRGCPDTIYKTLIIEPDWVFYVPNAFSPNDDGINEDFIGKGINVIEHRMWIYDRWGRLIYKTDSEEDGSAIPWNGKLHGYGEVVQEDTYVYVIKIIDVFGKRHKYVGHVTLVR